jgi:hypothetical protein
LPVNRVQESVDLIAKLDKGSNVGVKHGRESIFRDAYVRNLAGCLNQRGEFGLLKPGGGF